MSRRYDFAAMTRDDALAALVDLDVSRWGEQEREASRTMHAGKSRGLLINSIAHHQAHDFGEALTDEERAAAKAQLTSSDDDELRKGG